MVLESEVWQADPEIQKLPTLDILLAFEDYSRVREREFEEQARRAQVEKNRKERKAREGFKVCVTLISRSIDHTYGDFRPSYKNSSSRVRLNPGPSGRPSTRCSRTTTVTPTFSGAPVPGP